MEVVVDSLQLLQTKLRGETLRTQFLWDGNRPKSEEAISDLVKGHLEDDLKQRGVVVVREVQIHRQERTDIHVDAVIRDERNEVFDLVKVIIEVKGCWHTELKTAMTTQLVER